jgi:mevalonate kinase
MVDWFQNPTIIIAFIDKLMTVNYNKSIIDKLYVILYNILSNLMIDIEKNNKEYIQWGIIYAKEYIQYLLNCKDLTKLKPTQNFGFMYITYYMDFNNILITKNNYKLSYIINNNLFDSNILEWLFDDFSHIKNNNNKRIREVSFE